MIQNISVYKSAKDNTGAISDISSVLKAIRDGRYKETVERLRGMDKEDYDAAKATELVGATFSGSFFVRNKNNCITYTGIIVMDFDDKNDANILSHIPAIKADPLTFSLFISPSGKGLKVLVKVNTTEHYHEDAWNRLYWYFYKKHGIKADVSGKDVSRLCFLSYDPELYYNGNARTFMIGTLKKEPITDINKLFDIAQKWTERKVNFTDGQRNQYVFHLACNLNRFGVIESEAMYRILNMGGIDAKLQKEYEATIKSAYNRSAEHNSIVLHDKKEKEIYSSNIAEDEIIRSSIELLRHKVPPATIKELMEHKMYKFLPNGDSNVSPEDIGMGANWLKNTLNKAHNTLITSLRENVSAKRLGTVESVLSSLSNKKMGMAISTRVPEFDDVLGGGMIVGNVYGAIGHPKTKKSIYAKWIACGAAESGIPVAFWNGEEGELQFLNKITKHELSIDITEYIEKGEADKIKLTIDELNKKLNNNFYLISESGFSAKAIADHVELVRMQHKKEIKFVIIDGITHMEDMKGNEILSAIENSKLLKEVAKSANVAILVLIHLSGNSDKHFRNAVKFVRGGKKMEANLDASFSTSLCIDAEKTNFDQDDIIYKPEFAYIRCEDKRSTGNIADKVISVTDPLFIQAVELKPKSFDVDNVKSKNRY